MQQSSPISGTQDVDRSSSVAIVHRNRLMRDCLAKVLSDRFRHHVLNVDHTIDLNLQVLEDHSPEVVLVDLNIAENHGLALIRRLQMSSIQAKIIAVGTAGQTERFLECFQLGVHSFFLEESSIDELERAIQDVLKGGTFCSAQIVQAVFCQMSQSAQTTNSYCRNADARLTVREKEILQLIGEQLSNKQIAKRLSVSLYTVKNHVHNILEKLQVDSRFGAVEYVRQSKLPPSRSSFAALARI